MAPEAGDAHPLITAFVGVLRPDGSSEIGPAFSQAGQLFQERLLCALASAGVDITCVYSQRPVASFPTGRLWLGTSTGTIGGRFRAVFLPLLNFGPAKTLTVGLGLFARLLEWGWRNRDAGSRTLLLYNVGAPPGIVSLAASRLINASVVAVVADIQIPGSGLVPGTFLRRVEHWLVRWTLPRCDGLIVLTEDMARDFAPNVPHIGMEGAVPDGTPDAAALGRGYQARERAEAPSDAPVVLMYAGGLSELKGIPLLLSAMAYLHEPSYLLWITGDGPLRATVEAAAAADPRIRYWGFAPYSEVLQLMREATILINPHSTGLESARYVFPSKLIEYLASGKPVISTASSPVTVEQYRDVMFTVDEDTPEALAAAIRMVSALPPQDLATMGARGREYVLSHKSWSAQGLRIANFMREIVGRRRHIEVAG